MNLTIMIMIIIIIIIISNIYRGPAVEKIETNIGEKSKLKKAGGGRRRAEQ